MELIARLFSRSNLTQASTLRSFVGFGAAIGLWHLTPDQQAQATSLACALIADVTKFLGDVHFAYAFINFVKNDHKVIVVAPAAQPVYPAGSETIKKG